MFYCYGRSLSQVSEVKDPQGREALRALMRLFMCFLGSRGLKKKLHFLGLELKLEVKPRVGKASALSCFLESGASFVRATEASDSPTTRLALRLGSKVCRANRRQPMNRTMMSNTTMNPCGVSVLVSYVEHPQVCSQGFASGGHFQISAICRIYVTWTQISESHEE